MISALLILEGQEPRPLDMLTLRQKKSREEILAQTWQCKFCGKPMRPRMGAIRALKRAAGEALRRHFGKQVATLEYEVRFPHLGRIAGAVLSLTDGTRIAVEAQLSPLTLEQRTSSYLQDEIEVVWVFQEQEYGGLKPRSL